MRNIFNIIKNLFVKYRARLEFNKFIKENPHMMVCPWCLNDCGQCGGDGHHIKLKDLKSHPDYKKGWTGLLSRLTRK